mgnify:CR=1 FL=1
MQVTVIERLESDVTTAALFQIEELINRCLLPCLHERIASRRLLCKDVFYASYKSYLSFAKNRCLSGKFPLLLVNLQIIFCSAIWA